MGETNVNARLTAPPLPKPGKACPERGRRDWAPQGFTVCSMRIVAGHPAALNHRFKRVISSSLPFVVVTEPKFQVVLELLNRIKPRGDLRQAARILFADLRMFRILPTENQLRNSPTLSFKDSPTRPNIARPVRAGFPLIGLSRSRA